MAIKKWSQAPILTSISPTTMFCIIDGADPKNMIISGDAIFGNYISGFRLDEWSQYVVGETEEWILSAKLGKELKDRIDAGFTFVLTKEMVEAVLVGTISSHNHIELDPIFTNSPAFNISTLDISKWNTAYSWGNHTAAGYITANSVDTLTNKSGNISMWTNDVGYLTEYIETDPIFIGSPAYTITNLDISNWDTAFSWGNHADVGYLTGTKVDSFNGRTGIVTLTKLDVENVLTGEITTHTHDSRYYTETEINNFFNGSNSISGYNKANWDAAYSHSTTVTGSIHGSTTVGGNFLRLTNPSAITFIRINADNTVSTLDAASFRAAIGAGTSSTSGTVTSVAMTVPTGFTVSGTPITSNGTLALTFTSGYSLPADSLQTNWSSAYTFTSGFATNYPDLTAIEALAGTSGLLKKTAANTWSLDTNTYLTSNQPITLSGQATGSGTTAITVTLDNASVIAKVLTGYTATSGTISATDSLLTAIQKLGYDKHVSVTIGTANGLSLSTQTLSLALASTSITGALSSTDWNTFNSKQPQLNGTGLVRMSGTTVSYDNSTYITGITKSMVEAVFTGNITTHTHSLLTQPDGTNPFVYTDNAGTLHVDGDIVQNGSAYETHVEQVFTKNNLITLREGAIAGMAVGEYAGFVAKLYDGVNDGQLVFDKDGIARVGDVGSLQPLATRIESPTNGYFAYWETANTRLNFKQLAIADVPGLQTAIDGKQPLNANLTSLSALTYSSASFVKMTGNNQFSLDTNAYSLSSHNHSGVYEPVLGNPSVSGYLLSSTTAGVRSWVAPYSHPSTHPWSIITGTPTTLAGYGIADAAPLSHVGATGAAHGVATQSIAGFMSATDKTKLDGLSNYTLSAATSSVLGGLKIFSDTVQTVASNAISATTARTYGVQFNSSGQAVVNIPWTDTVYTHPSLNHIPTGGSTGQLLQWASAGTAQWWTPNYLTSFTETDPIFTASQAYSITAADKTNWQAGYSFSVNFDTLKPDLAAIEALSGTSGLLRKTAANTWALDTTSYLTSTSLANVAYNNIDNNFSSVQTIIAPLPLLLRSNSVNGGINAIITGEGRNIAGSYMYSRILLSDGNPSGLGIGDTIYKGSICMDTTNALLYIATSTANYPTWSVLGTGTSNLALGETSSTAYRGDRGKIAYDHSQTAHQSILNGTGFVKVSGTTVSYDNTSYLPLAGGTLSGGLSIQSLVPLLSIRGSQAGARNYTFYGSYATPDDLVLRDETVNGYIFRVAPSGSFDIYINATISGNQIWHAGNDGAGSGLDADLLDGINSERFVFGTTTAAITSLSSLNVNDIWKAGFYSLYNTTNAPFVSDGGLINIPTWGGSNSSNRYNLQVASQLEGDILYFRTTAADGSGTWKTIWHSGNLTGDQTSGHYHTQINSVAVSDLNFAPSTMGIYYHNYNSSASNIPIVFDNANAVLTMVSHPSGGVGTYGKQITFADNDDLYMRYFQNGGFYPWRKIWHDGNLTSTLTTNYLPKWDGSKLVNSNIISESTRIRLITYADIQGMSYSLPATSGITQTGLALRLRDTRDGGDVTLDFGNAANYSASWIQCTDIRSLATNHSLLLNPNGGSVFVGYTADPTSGNKLAVNGAAYINGNLTCAGSGTFSGGGFNSERHLKNIYTDKQFDIEGIFGKLKVRDFHYKERPDYDRTLGLIVDEVDGSISEWLLSGEKSNSINTYTLHGLSILAHQKTFSEIDMLKQRVSELETELRELKGGMM